MPDYRALAQALGTSQPTPQEIERMAALQSPAFGVFPQMKPYRSEQDITASANVPVDLLRGRIAGTRGLFGDVVNQPIPMVRPLQLLSQAFTGQQKYPDTEHYLETMPLKSNTPIGDVAGRIGSFAPINPMPAVKGYLSLLGNEINAGMTGQPTRSVIGQITPKPLQLDVYHGTPHSFERFDASKIGTGEGAQAYGHGIYVAENPEVAKRYQYQLAPERNARDLNTKVNYIKIGDKPINPDNYDIDIQQELVDAAKLGKKEFLDFANQRRTRWEELSKDESYPYRGTANERVNEYNKLISDAKELGVTYTGSGTLYKADLPDEMIPTMLDWDKPITPMGNLQIKPVAKDYNGPYGTGEYGGYAWHLGDIQIDKAFRTPENAQKYAPYGNQLIKELNAITGTPTGHAELLQKAGIPGIKYLDEGSRGTNYRGDSAFFHAATDFKNNDYSLSDALQEMKKAYKNASEQELRDALDAVYTPKTSNFVVFPGEEQNIKILERNAEKTTK